MRQRVVFGAAGFVVGAALSLVATEVVHPAVAGRDDAEPGALVLMTGADESVGQQRLELIEQWNAVRPENPVTVVQLPPNADAAHSQMVAQAQSGEQQVDVLNLDVTWIAEFAEAGYIVPLDDVDTTGFLAKPLSTCRYEGELWALPFNTDAALLYYRSDLLVDKTPTTWRQLRAAVRDTPDAPPVGLATQLDDYEGGTVAIAEAVWAEGGELVVDDEVVLDSPEAQAGLEALREDVHDPDINLARSLDADEARSTDVFAGGEALFLRNWPIANRYLDAEGVEFSSTTLPSPSALGGQNLAVSARSANKGAARELVEFLTSPRSQQLLFERGGLAATREIVYLDPMVLESHPYARTLLRAIEDAKLRPVGPHYNRFSHQLRAVVRELLVGGRLPPDYLERLDRAWKGR